MERILEALLTLRLLEYLQTTLHLCVSNLQYSNAHGEAGKCSTTALSHLITVVLLAYAPTS